MTKLSDTLGQKPQETDATRIVPLPVTASGKGRRSDTAAAPGGDRNESLHHLVIDTRRKIDELDEIKQAFDLMVVPFSTAMRELEQERLLSKNLAGQLSEKTDAYEKTHDELQQTKHRLSQIESEAQSLRGSLTHAREAGRALESAQAQLTEEVNRRGSQIVELERRLGQETTQRETLTESCRTLKDQAIRAEKRIDELQRNLEAATQKSAALEEDKRTLHNSLDQALNEITGLKRRLDEISSTATTLRANLGKLETRNAELSNERNNLATALHELSEQRQTERKSLNERIEALQSRANAADRLAVEMRQRLIARTEEARAFITKTAEATLARGTAERRLAEIEILQGGNERDESDPARSTLTDFLQALGTSAPPAVLPGATEKFAAPRGRDNDAASRTMPGAAEERAEKPAVDSERILAGLEVALEATRKRNERLGDDIAGLRTALNEPTTGGTPAKAVAGEAEQARESEEARIAREREEARVAREIEAYVPRKAIPRNGALPHDSLFGSRSRRPGEADDAGRNILSRIGTTIPQ